MQITVCPLCNYDNDNMFYKDKIRSYYQCSNCKLIYVPTKDLLSPEVEKSRYDKHQNNPSDQNYRKFLNRMLKPMLEHISKGDNGLDFGSGPGPTLSLMFEESGYDMEIYDHFYANNPAVLEKEYDFITTTEVAEHLHKPKVTLDKLWSILKSGGTLGIMTKLSTGVEDFPKWHYKNDDTHVCFFARESFEWLAKQWDADTEFIGNDVLLLKKTNHQ